MALDREADDRARRRARGDVGGRARHPRLLHHRRPQAHRHALHLHGVRLLLHRRAARAGDARPARRAERRRAEPGDVQRVLHDARHDDDLPVQHAGARRVRQLPHPADDRQPRHGVPAAERVQLLDLPVRRRSSCTRASSSATRPTAAGSPTCRSPSKPYSPGINIDFWGLGVIFVGISTTVGAVNFIVTIFKLRAPGMTLNRMPIFVWSMLVFSFMVIFAVPAVTVAAGAARARPALRHDLLRRRRTAAARCCTSTCSGSGAIPRCTSCSSPPPA